MAAAKEKAKELDSLVQKQAIFGVDGIRTILLKAYDTFGGGTSIPFDT